MDTVREFIQYFRRLQIMYEINHYENYLNNLDKYPDIDIDWYKAKRHYHLKKLLEFQLANFKQELT